MSDKQEMSISTKHNIIPGDWVKMAGIGFDIYGKVIYRDFESGQIRIITSSVMNNRSKPKSSPDDMNLVKIDVKEVPQRARLWILSRISNPPDDSNTVQAPQPPDSLA